MPLPGIVCPFCDELEVRHDLSIGQWANEQLLIEGIGGQRIAIQESDCCYQRADAAM